MKKYKGPIKEYLGIKYRTYTYEYEFWFWETRKFFVWATYGHACYESQSDAEQAARNGIESVRNGSKIF